MAEGQARPTIETVKSSPYADEAWEVMGEFSEMQEFMPLELEEADVNARVIDTMFPAYDEGQSPENKRFWHLSPDSDFVSKEEKEDELAGKIILSEEELNEKIELARQEGKEASRAEIEIERQQEREVQVERMNAILKDMVLQSEENLLILEEKTLNLATKIAEKLVGHAVEINPEYIIPLIKEALEKVGSAKIKNVRTSQQDLEFIEILGLKRTIKDFSEIEFIADESIHAGCIVETSAGEIDFDIDTAFNRIQDFVLRSK